MTFPHSREGEGLTLLVLDRIAIERLFLPGGQAFRWARLLGEEVALDAKGLLVPGAGYRTGRLQRSVGSSAVPVLQGVQVNVRATAKHALFYVLGTAPHSIASNRVITIKSGPFAGRSTPGYLRWENASGTHFKQIVNHPGFRGRNFLNEAKDAVLARRGITRV